MRRNTFLIGSAEDPGGVRQFWQDWLTGLLVLRPFSAWADALPARLCGSVRQSYSVKIISEDR
jgi:hypothetical protein